MRTPTPRFVSRALAALFVLSTLAVASGQTARKPPVALKSRKLRALPMECVIQ